MKLGELQQSFQDHVLKGDPGITPEIATDHRFAVPLRLGVYTQAYVARLVEVLGETFPALHRIVGAAAFNARVGEFVRLHPSRHRSARDYGAELSMWLASRADGPRAQGLAQLARLEWAMAGAFDAADEVALSPHGLTGLAPEQWPTLRFTFSATLRRVTVSSNCVAWWRSACAGQPRPPRWRSTCTQDWLIWREALAVFYRRMSRAETLALDVALAGGSFGMLCEQLADPAAAAAMLHRWFCAGLVVGAVPTGDIG